MAHLCAAQLHRRLHGRGEFRPLQPRPDRCYSGSLRYTLDARAVPSGAVRVQAYRDAMAKMMQDELVAKHILGFECGAPASWAQRQQIPIRLQRTSDAADQAATWVVQEVCSGVRVREVLACLLELTWYRADR